MGQNDLKWGNFSSTKHLLSLYRSPTCMWRWPSPVRRQPAKLVRYALACSNHVLHATSLLTLIDRPCNLPMLLI